MSTVLRISSIIALISILTITQLSANEVTEKEVSMAYPCISVDKLDFGKVLVNESRTGNTTISNHGSSLLTITGYSYENENADGVYGTSLGEISPEKPLTIMAGEAATISVTFTPKEMKNYTDKIIFESDAEETCADNDPILELNGYGDNLLIEPISDITIFMNTTANIPIITNSTKPSTLKVTLAGDYPPLFPMDSTAITGNNNTFNLKISPIKEKIGSCYLEVDAQDEIRSGSTTFKFTVKTGGSVHDSSPENKDIFISPNPVSNTSVSIKYTLENNCNVLLSLYNSNGMLIRNILNEFQIAGNQTFTLSVDELPADIYFVEFRAGAVVGHKSFVVVK